MRVFLAIVLPIPFHAVSIACFVFASACDRMTDLFDYTADMFSTAAESIENYWIEQ